MKQNFLRFALICASVVAVSCGRGTSTLLNATGTSENSGVAETNGPENAFSLNLGDSDLAKNYEIVKVSLYGPKNFVKEFKQGEEIKFDKIPAGVYQLKLELTSNGQVTAMGETKIVVESGKTTVADLELVKPNDGSGSIIVNIQSKVFNTSVAELDLQNGSFSEKNCNNFSYIYLPAQNLLKFSDNCLFPEVPVVSVQPVGNIPPTASTAQAVPGSNTSVAPLAPNPVVKTPVPPEKPILIPGDKPTISVPGQGTSISNSGSVNSTEIAMQEFKLSAKQKKEFENILEKLMYVKLSPDYNANVKCIAPGAQPSAISKSIKGGELRYSLGENYICTPNLSGTIATENFNNVILAVRKFLQSNYSAAGSMNWFEMFCAARAACSTLYAPAKCTLGKFVAEGANSCDARENLKSKVCSLEIKQQRYTEKDLVCEQLVYIK